MAGAEELDEDGGGDRGNPGGAEQSPRVGSISFKDKDGRIEPKKQEPKKLGVIGRGLKSKPQVGADVSIATAAKTLDEQPRLHQNRAQELETDPKQPTVEETEEQKADRKRAELKRQLEEKTKTQGRKKRRF
ncbi:MAG: hypothetical protein M1817_003340 [Caeruleum heppii]|nr:MAG: hypothetical protein M1817_003340 [Caeruleum heppii]